MLQMSSQGKHRSHWKPLPTLMITHPLLAARAVRLQLASSSSPPGDALSMSQGLVLLLAAAMCHQKTWQLQEQQAVQCSHRF